MLGKLKLGFKGTNNWNKYQSKVSIKRQNQYWDYVVDAGFQGVNRLFVLSFEDNAIRTRHTRYFLSIVEIKDYNITIDGQKCFDQSIKKDF